MTGDGFARTEMLYMGWGYAPMVVMVLHMVYSGANADGSSVAFDKTSTPMVSSLVSSRFFVLGKPGASRMTVPAPVGSCPIGALIIVATDSSISCCSGLLVSFTSS